MESSTLSIIITAIIGIFSIAITVLLAVSAFFIVNWIKRQELAVHKLTSVLTSLQLTFQELGGDFKRLAEDVENHDQILRTMPVAIHGGCSTEGCPFYDPDKTPVPRHIRTRLTDPKD